MRARAVELLVLLKRYHAVQTDDSSTLSTQSATPRGVPLGPSVSVDQAIQWGSSARWGLVDQPRQAERNPPQAASQSMAAAPRRAKARPVARALTSEVQPMAAVNMASWNPDPSGGDSGLLHANSSSSVDAEPRGLVAASASASVTAAQQPFNVPSASTTMAGWTRDTSALLSDTMASAGGASAAFRPSPPPCAASVRCDARRVVDPGLWPHASNCVSGARCSFHSQRPDGRVRACRYPTHTGKPAVAAKPRKRAPALQSRKPDVAVGGFCAREGHAEPSASGANRPVQVADTACQPACFRLTLCRAHS